jgi:hypothetical protein
MQIPLSRSVAMSMIVARILTFVALGALILISIAFDCTSINVCTSIDGYIIASAMSSSFASFYTACASTNYYSTTSFSPDFSMYTRSIDIVAHGPTCSLTLQLLLHLCKNLIIDAPDL